MDLRTALVAFIVAFLASGCATTQRPPTHVGESRSERDPGGVQLVRVASTLIGTPYRYGGEDPSGFDCSGLVHYSFNRLGLKVPRTAAAQRKAASRVQRDELEPGDLVFFRTTRGPVDHVGIYAGEGRFIHSPRAGQVVSYAYLDDPYYRKHFVSAGRF